MKRLTANIRVCDYSVLTNSFEIKFQLRPASVFGPEFTFTVDEKLLRMTDDTAFELQGLGLSGAEIDQVYTEVIEWIGKDRAKLGGESWDQIMWRRCNTGMQAKANREAAEQERRGRAEADRIVIASPPMDFARTALDELEANAFIVDNLDTLAGDPAWDEPAERVSAASEWETLTPEIAKALMKTAVSMEEVDLGEPPVENTTIIHPDLAKKLAEKKAAYELIASKLPTVEIDKAVDEIHTHMIRFLDSKLSMREHNFIRPVVEQEIEKVVRGAL